MEFELTVANLQPSAYTTGPMADSDIPLIRDDARTETGKIFFCKLRDAVGFHITPTTEQPKRRCVGP